jgi:hypothetical protein
VAVLLAACGALAAGGGRSARAQPPTPSPAHTDEATAAARSHYEMGVKLFDAREHEQALIEFTRANEIKPRPGAVFMMAQCEYLLGRLKEARAHYQDYVNELPDGEFAALARDRIESIDKRPSVFVINTVPDDVTVQISPAAETGHVVASGQAPNNFSVPRGRYRVDVTKQNFQGQTRIIDVDIAETKPLFFKLEPIPARLAIETYPPGATLYVNGNRARNPYRQEITPGHVEIFAEATDYDSKTVDLQLGPGEQRSLTGAARVRLPYHQRSGRAELVVASSILGGLLGAGGVAAAIGKNLDNSNVASVLLIGGGGIAGAVAGAVVATPLVPNYIPDNQALFILGGAWIGAAEGAGAGMLAVQVDTYSSSDTQGCPVATSGAVGPGPCRPTAGRQLQGAFVGSLPGLAVGLTAGSLFARKAPTYGRVTLIQSAALGGAITGALVQVALQWKPYGGNWDYTTLSTPASGDTVGTARAANGTGKPCVANGTNECLFYTSSVLDVVPGALIGLNVGLIGGLLGAYLPNQSKYGPSWRRVLLVDLAAGAGALAAGIGACVALVDGCLIAAQPDPDARSFAAVAAVGGGILALSAGLVLTRHIDDDIDANRSVPGPALMPVATFAPMRAANGTTVPGFVGLVQF